MGLGCSVDVARAAVCESCNCVDDSFEGSRVWAQGCFSRSSLDSRDEGVFDHPHPLLCRSHEDDTPRGPTPPWAVHNTECEPVDKTSTGATPPRMLVAIRCSPPGLPEELDQSHNQPGLLVALGAGFCRDLFRAARTGNDELLEKLIKNAYTSCVRRGGSGDLDDGTAEEVSSMLSFARDVGTGETLLGAAAKHGEALVVRLLLLNSANPTISDSRGRNALHRAAEGGDLLTTLLVLDRLQSADRFLSVTDFVDNHGETPGVVASSAGSSAVCGALEIFGDMQLNAEQQYVGQLGKPGVRNDILSSLDFGSEAANASLQCLREASLGSALVPKIWPQTQAGFDLADALNQAFQGLQQAEDLLMNGSWKPSQFGLPSGLKQVVRTIDLRVRWQRLRTDAMAGASSKALEEFWQTHLSAARMAKLTRGEGNLQQIYLGILWLFTRESWLPHIMEAMAGFLRESSPEVMQAYEAMALQSLVQALSPMAQLVQAATCYFRQQGVRHEGVTFRPVVLPPSVLKSMIDRFLECKEERQQSSEATECADAEGLETGMWFILSHGSFPTAFASRWDAGKRLAKTSSNVLLAIQADPKFPSFPEHMSLKGGGDDPRLKRQNACLRSAAMSRVYLEHRDANHVPPPQTAAEVSAAVEAAAEAVASCDALIFTAGAGMGVDCGLPDFRGSSGLFKDRDVAMTYEEMSDDKWFAEDPLFAWGINYTQLSMYRHTQPHEGYAVLLRWATTLGKPYYVWTSNIDGMFEKVGFSPEKVVTCHGDLHHLQCTKDRRKCRGLREDRSDEVWPAAVIPDGLDTEIDPGGLRFRDAVHLERDCFKCPRCGSLARPNVWFCHDKNYNASTDALVRGDAYNQWLWKLHENKAAIVVVECGGGLAIPSVRVQGEDAVDGGGKGSRLIRINPVHCKVPPTNGIGIPMGSMQGLKLLDAALMKPKAKCKKDVKAAARKPSPGIFPAGTLFRLVRMSRTTSSELDSEACPKGSAMQWPVTVIELAATDPRPQAFLLLQRRGCLRPGEIQDALISWAAEQKGAEREQRVRDAAAWLYQSAEDEAAEMLLERSLHGDAAVDDVVQEERLVINVLERPRQPARCILPT
ncbi:NAD-dependent protein deacylase [Symbiodinium microadriaticum]|uniref:NAD-dependent protein deacylase n=1 Tax=Symbiodinium microadriaticum TaxID=2951 RepID=A0A1Q9CCB1_SYMMI|nr:NAD-dependent protein deacylase [Symbiodinium microadriaticum]CAE7176797.1 SRT1505 [Symbiodinium microadriaticum]